MTADQIQDLKALLDKATPEEVELMKSIEGVIKIVTKGTDKLCGITISDKKLYCALRNNAEELIRLARVGKNTEEIFYSTAKSRQRKRAEGKR